MVRDAGGPLVWLLMSMFLTSPQQGAITQLFAATSPTVREKAEMYGGQYLVPYGEIGKPSELAQKEELGDDLWALTERVVKQILAEGKV